MHLSHIGAVIAKSQVLTSMSSSILSYFDHVLKVFNALFQNMWDVSIIWIWNTGTFGELGFVVLLGAVVALWN